jgi:hypothetical protein
MQGTKNVKRMTDSRGQIEEDARDVDMWRNLVFVKENDCRLESPRIN